MINGMRVIALIPARGGSKSIPNKNIKPLGGKPLIAWPIELALETTEIDRVIVSTDDPKIKSVSQQYGAEVMDRPNSLAEDDSLVIDTIRHAIKELREQGETAELMVLLEPTSPFRTRSDIYECLSLLIDKAKQYDSIATFTRADLNPHRAWRIEDDEPKVFVEGAIPWLPRQKLPDAYQLNGAVYAFKIDNLQENEISLLFGKIGAFIMPKVRSIDIDNEIQIELAEIMIKRGINNE